MKKHLLKSLLALALVLISGNAWAEKVEYSFTISTSDFNSTSYAANNNEKTTVAKGTSDATKTMEVKWTSNQVMLNSEAMQWQKSKGAIYNSTDLGTIKSVTVTSTAGTFTTYYGSTEQPASGTTVGGGYFQIKVGGATGKSSKVEVVFEIDADAAIDPKVEIGSKTLYMAGDKTTTVTTDGPAVTLSTSDASIASVSGTTVTGEANGNVVITATWSAGTVGGKKYNAGSQEFDVRVFAVEDGVFDFTVGWAYGSGLTPSSSQQPSNNPNPYVFTAGKVTVTTAGTGSFVWNTDFRLYANSSAVIAVPDGYVITKIDFTGATMTNGTIEGAAFENATSNTWTGKKKSVTIARGTGTLTINTMTVTYAEATGEVANLSIDATKLAVSGGTPNAANITTDPAGLAVSYTSDSPGVATVNDAGVVTAVSGGTATITATWAKQTVGGTAYDSGTQDFTVTVYDVEDGYFDFKTSVLTYGSGLTPSSSTEYITTESTWTAGNVTMKVAGKYRWWLADGSLRLFDTGTTENSKLTISVPDGSHITKIVAGGGGNLTADKGTKSGTTWTGYENSVVLTYGGSGTITLTNVTVTYTDESSKIVTVSAYDYATASFDVEVVVPSENTVYTVSDVTSEGVVQLTALAANTVLPRNTGVIINKAGGGEVTLNYTNASPAEVTTKLYTYGTIKTTDYILSVNENDKFGFCHPTTSIAAPAGKAYLPASAVPSNAPFLRIGGTTRIANAEAEAETGEYYDLTGRKVEQPQRGIYIVGGKKVMVK